MTSGWSRGNQAFSLRTSPVHRIVLRGAIAGHARPAVFLDRDGVVNVDRRYVHRQEDFEFMPMVLAACRQLVADGFALVVMTNQAGIARGYYTTEDFLRLSQWMTARFAEAGAPLDGIYFCPHHPQGSVPELSIRCTCRKPEPGMILTAAEDLRLDLTRSALIGDKWSDIAAGRRAGMRKCLLLRAAVGSAESEQDIAVEDGVLADERVTDLAEAARYLQIP